MPARVSADDRATWFHDVGSGSNGAFDAGAGWDAVTGFGSMNAATMLAYLQSQ